MKHSPLQLLRYVVADVACTATPTFDPSKPFDSTTTDLLSVDATVTQQEAPEDFPGHSWSAEMSISQTLKDGQNFPYTFKLSLVGFFACHDGFASPEDEERFVRVNGSSMLYGAAREIIRSATSCGPWGELFLPGVSFYDKGNSSKEDQATPSIDP
jgi:preprotein translocase subunit SecB